ncbi:SURF1 family protein [Corynebacterium sp. SCR221107]|uniref:SURF1 family cytochrome oxidase biogenesis protein n=1 Tax=Corynebacterium sp. SCR221107 TaxID=3017361 RepID=UPI0022EC1E70|nr:SURF1 family protein [Corynebacterium sp. SCR221107]WBT08083.1 SURF1 family protein [Corynebacterium sp. SCR221107]
MATKTRGDAPKAGWRQFLTPGWILTVLLVIAFSYTAITVLSPWQLNKDDAIVAQNEHVDRAFKEDPQDFDHVFNADGSIKEDQEWMRVEISGHFLADKEVLLRMRPVDSTPAYQSLTPFQIDGGPIMLVNRGYVPTTAGDKPNIPAATSEQITITANARVNEAIPSTAPLNEDGYDQVYGINTEQISELTGLDLGKDYMQLTSSSPGVLTPMPVPKQDRGNHLSYGFQWIAFGIMAPLGLAYMAYSEVRERRRARAEADEMDSVEQLTEESAKSVATPEPSEEDEQTLREKQLMRSRYGDSHPNRYARKRR